MSDAKRQVAVAIQYEKRLAKLADGNERFRPPWRRQKNEVDRLERSLRISYTRLGRAKRETSRIIRERRVARVSASMRGTLNYPVELERLLERLSEKPPASRPN